MDEEELKRVREGIKMGEIQTKNVRYHRRKATADEKTNSTGKTVQLKTGKTLSIKCKTKHPCIIGQCI